MSYKYSDEEIVDLYYSEGIGELIRTLDYDNIGNPRTAKLLKTAQKAASAFTEHIKEIELGLIHAESKAGDE